jgi:excisionase family DNA binding protein
MNPLGQWLSTSEAAKLSGYHPDHIRRLIRSGEVAGRKWGNAWMVDKESLLNHVQKMNAQGERRGPKPGSDGIMPM